MALRKFDTSPVVVGGGKIRSELDDLVVVGNCPVQLPFFRSTSPPLVVSGGKSRIELDGLIVIGDSPVTYRLSCPWPFPGCSRRGHISD
jgi:hypothetical protein